ncbi:MAG: phosphotransferase-like protein [Chlamydiia bacterium]
MAAEIRAIYLNGPSSVGKSTLARALQAALPDLWLHFGIDRVIAWMGPQLNQWDGIADQPMPGFSWRLGADNEVHLQVGPAGAHMNKLYGDLVTLDAPTTF